MEKVLVLEKKQTLLPHKVKAAYLCMLTDGNRFS